MKPTTPLAVALAAAVALAGCAGGPPARDCPATGTPVQVHIDGSSTVYPIAEAWAEEFAPCAGIDAKVAFSGTGGGFQKLCRGEIDVAGASRPIKTGAGSETEACGKAGIAPFAIQVAIDGLAVVVPASNTFVDHLTVSELNKIWTQEAGKQVDRWSQLRPGWPDEEIDLYGAGTNSGTFDYFVEVVIHPFDGSGSKGRSDYTPSEDDHVLVQGVAGSAYALGYFGLAYARESSDRLRIVPILEDTKDGGKTYVSGATAVEPTDANVESGKYAPLARPLFMYTDGAPTGALREWFRLGLSPEGQQVVEDVRYVKLNEDQRAEMLAKIG